MESMILTPRLACIADLIPQNARLADIGTDHGKLPIALLLAERAESAIGSDIGEGPLLHAARNAKEHGVNLSLRLSSGLQAVRPEECDTISIAGMGGQTIAEILSDAPWTAAGKHLLLLQPMTMVYELRQWLWQNGYEVEKETLCREGRRWYIIFSARGGAEKRVVPRSQCSVSPALLKEKEAPDYLLWLLAREQRALRGMKKGKQVCAEQITAQKELVQTLVNVLEELK